ncbi:BIRC2_3 [Mytilus coruscus]|uniref:BIRC2_3 n=1 Tax=Mytilus coruscus TaxID=42192 RepID=A0A6J8BA88_MYTCO|nr:BIRC2_3 [Mytilus coruscus]
MRSKTGQMLNETKLSDEMDNTEFKDVKLHHHDHEDDDDINHIKRLGNTKQWDDISGHEYQQEDTNLDVKCFPFVKNKKYWSDTCEEDKEKCSFETFSWKQNEILEVESSYAVSDSCMLLNPDVLHDIDLQICSEVKCKRDVKIVEVEIANQEELNKRLSNNDEPYLTMQNHKTCTETSQNYARSSQMNGRKKLIASKVEHDIQGRIKYGSKESIEQFLNAVVNFCLMTTTRSGGKLSLTLLLLLMLSTAHSKQINKTEISSVCASSNGSILCQEMEKCLHLYSSVFRNMTKNSRWLLNRTRTRVICYDAKQHICCRQKLYNISSHLFQKCYGAELHNPAIQMCLVLWRKFKCFIVGRTIERSSEKKGKNPFKIDDCYLLFSPLLKKETFINLSELKGASPYFSSTKKASRHKKKSQDSHSQEHTSNFFRVIILCFLIIAAYLVIVEGYSLLLRTTVKIAVAVLVWMTFSAVNQYKVMEQVIYWKERLGRKQKDFTVAATANTLTIFERLGILLRHFSCMITGIWVLAMYARKLNPLEVMLVYSIVCIMMISTLWTVYLVNLPILKICKILSTIGSALGICSMATLNSTYLLIMYLVRKMFPIIAKLFCNMKNIEYQKMYIGIIKVIMIFIQCQKYLCLSLEEICDKVISESKENVPLNSLESEKEEVKIILSEEKICNLSEHEFESCSRKDSLFTDDVLTNKKSDFEKEEYEKGTSFEVSDVDCDMSEESLLTIKDKTGESFLKVKNVEEVKDIQEQDENICKNKDMFDNTNSDTENCSVQYNFELLSEKFKEKHLYTKDKIVHLSSTVKTEYYGKQMETDIHEETSAKAVVNSSSSEADGMNDHNDLSDSSHLSINDFGEDQEFGVTTNGYNIRLCTETSEIEPMGSEISFCRMFDEDANVSPVGHCTCHADESSVRDKVWFTPDDHIMPVTEMDEVNSCHKFSQCSDSNKSEKSYISSICNGCSSNSYSQDVKVYSCESGGSALTNSTDYGKNLKSLSVSDEELSQHKNSDEPMYSSKSVIDLQKKQETKAVNTKYSDEEDILKKFKKHSNDNDIASIVRNSLKELARKEVAKICKILSKSHEKCKRKHKKRRISRRRLRRIIFSNRSNSQLSCQLQVTPVQNSPQLHAGSINVSHTNQNANPNGTNLNLQHVQQQNAVQNGLNNIPSDMRPDAASATVSKSSIATSLPASSSSLSTYFSRMLMGYEFSVEEKMQYEMLRVQTFQDLPATCHASPLRLARTGFFSTGINDEVVCFSCGVRYKNWQKRDDPMEIHRRISPECRMVNRRETRNIPIIPESNGFVSHNPQQESLPNLSNGFLQSTVNQDGGVSTQTAHSTQNRALTREDIRNANDADTTAQLRNQPQQPYAVQEALRQPAEEQQTIRPPSVDRAHSVLEGEQNRPAQRDMAEDLGITLERPKYPAYAQLNVRVSTFQGWPGYLDQAPRDMALAGFFYAGYNDYCRCFFCGGGLRNWDAGDDPWVEHARWFSKCAFVRQNRGHRFVEIIVKRQAEMQASGASGSAKNQTAVTTQSEIEARTQVTSQETSMAQTSIQSASANSNRDPAIESVRELGYSDEIIQRAVDIVKSHNPGKENIEARDILEVIFTITDDDTTTQTNTAVVSENTQTSAFGSSQASIQPVSKPSVSTATSQPQTATTSVPASTPESSLPSLSVSSLEVANATASVGKSGQAGANKEITENEIRSLQEENIQLKEQVMCKICMDKNVSIAFLPCGHLACCIDCAPAMRKCPMCRVYIKGTVKTYLA